MFNLCDVLVTPGTQRDEEVHVALLAVQLLLPGVGGHPSPSQAVTALVAYEVLLVVEFVTGLHGAVGDGLGTDGAGHDGHGEDGTTLPLLLTVSLPLYYRQSANYCVRGARADKTVTRLKNKFA